MAKVDPKVIYSMERLQRMKAQRSPFNTDWNDIRDFVRPITVSFNPATGQYISVRTELMFDGTAPEALEELGSALHSFITNPADRWFELQVEGVAQTDLDSDALEWLDRVSDIIYAYYSREDSCFNLALHECYLDIASFGTTCLYQSWDAETQGLLFMAKPLQQCYFLENSKGRVDTVHIVYNWNIRQIKQEFGEVLPPELMKVDKDDKVFEIVHCIYPRADRNSYSAMPSNMLLASCWICCETKELISESGFEALPYHVARWTKLSGEVYGRSPAKKCLPDIKMLNAMEKTILKAGQKITDPPLVLTHEAFMLPIRTSPGGLIFRENEENKVEPLITGANLPWAEDKAQQKRDFINKCFHIDWIRREKKRAEQTAFEVQDERDEMLRQLAPMLGRLVTELHGPMIARSYDLLNRHGKIPPAPSSLQGGTLRVGYLSPAARAQIGTRANQIGRFLQDLIPLSQANPDIMDVIDMDSAAQEYALARGVPRRILRSADEIAGIREQKKKVQAMQQLSQIAEPASKAIKNIADAQNVGGGM